MILDIIRVIIVLIGFFSTIYLFYKIPKLPKNNQVSCKSQIKVSILIPCRNEEANIHLLLKDLSHQTIMPHEIIVVDDDSNDHTKDVVKSFAVKLVIPSRKPETWVGKAWAIHEGIKVSTGEHYLFLDADVRLGPTALADLFCAYQGTPISIQPHHTTKKIYEQGSLFFNMVQVAANGTALKKPNHLGLFGPLILISKNHYELIGGHEAIKDSIIEDVSMGQLLKEHHIPFSVFIGDEVISFRMYGNGFKGLVEGWTKNLASGALKTPWFRKLLVFFWIASLTSIPIQLIRYGMNGSLSFLIFYAIFYLIWVVTLLILAPKIGSFKWMGIIFYPLLMVVFLLLFTSSLLHRLFGIRVKWKERSVQSRGKR